MRKSVFLGALALLASTTVASAVTVIKLDGYCNNYAVRSDHGTYSLKDINCLAHGFGAGFVGTVHDLGKTLIVGMHDPSNPNAQLVYQFSYPLTDGGTWTLYSTTDGMHTSVLSTGNYSIPAPGRKTAEPDDLKSATSR